MANYNFQYLPIKPSETPISKTFTIGTGTFIFTFRYNQRFDFYTVVISDLDENILYSSKIIYGETLYNVLIEGLTIDYPILPINLDDLFSERPIDITSQAVNAKTLDTRVRLYYNGTAI